MSSGGSTQPTSDTRSNSGIVANLADLNKLGMPGMLESSEAARPSLSGAVSGTRQSGIGSRPLTSAVASAQEKTNEDSASHYYGASMTDETMSHLAAFTKQERSERFHSSVHFTLFCGRDRQGVAHQMCM